MFCRFPKTPSRHLALFCPVPSPPHTSSLTRTHTVHHFPANMDDLVEKAQRKVERRLEDVRLLRVGLYTGPEFVGTDPGTGRLKYAWIDAGKLKYVSQRQGRRVLLFCPLCDPSR